MLVTDQKVTTQPVLAELDARGVTFLTLRMRSPALLRHHETPSALTTAQHVAALSAEAELGA